MSSNIVLPYITITEVDTRDEQVEQLRSELSTASESYENIKSVVFDRLYASPHAFNAVDALSGEDYVPIESEKTVWWTGGADIAQANISKYEEIRVEQMQDKFGRTIYVFDDKLTQHLMVVVFKMRGRYMVSVNEVLMPLEEFLSISTGRAMESQSTNTSKPWNERGIECTVAGKSFTIPNTTMHIILVALTTLEKDYGHMFESLG
jgi:hypothetical protein